MSGRVLCISAGAAMKFYEAANQPWFCSDNDELDRFKQLVHRHSFFVERSRAELDFGFIQLIPSCVILNGSRILCVERSSDSDRKELKSKWTVVFGGHVDEADADGFGNWLTILNGVTREVREELGVEVSSEMLKFSGIAIDPTNRTGRLHLGLVFCYYSDMDQLYLSDDLDLAEFAVSDSGVAHLLSPREVFKIQDNFDPWSTVFLRSEFARSRLSLGSFDEEELPLMWA